MDRLRKSPGNPVDGDRFFNRESELAELLEYLHEGHHVLLVAPRRVGKTSLMRQASLQLPESWHRLHVDVQDARSPEDVVVEIARSAYLSPVARPVVLDVFSPLFGSAELGVDELTLKLKDHVYGVWQARGRRLLEALCSSAQVAIFVDELPILLHRMAYRGGNTPDPAGRLAAEALMGWLRKVALSGSGRLRFVFAGSIGMEPILEELGISAAANHLTTFPLEPWRHDVGLACLKALSRQYGMWWEKGAAERVMHVLGLGVPHHVQVMFARLHSDARRRGVHHITPEDVERVYEQEIHGSALHRDLVHYEQRLDKVLPESHIPLALDLLTEASAAAEVSDDVARALADEKVDADADQALARILRILQHDGYLRRTSTGYAFGSSLLRDWWFGRFGHAWTPRGRT